MDEEQNELTVDELINNDNYWNKELSGRATSILENFVDEKFQFVKEKREFNPYELIVVEDELWAQTPYRSAQALHSRDKESGRNVILINRSKAQMLDIDIEGLRKEFEPNKNEYERLREKEVEFKKNNGEKLTQEEVSKLNELGRLKRRIQDYEETYRTLAHEWVHTQSITPEGLSPRGIAISEMFPLYFTGGIGYQDVKGIMDLLQVCLGRNEFKDIMKNSLSSTDPFNHLLETVKHLLGEDIGNSLLNYLPNTYKQFENLEDRVDFDYLATLLINYIKKLTPEQIDKGMVETFIKRQNFPEGHVITDKMVEELKNKIA